MYFKYTICTLLLAAVHTVNAQYAPAAGEPGTTAIHKDSSDIIEWATEVVFFQRGLADIANPDGALASFGDSTEALGPAEGNSTDIVSLGDLGTIVLTFDYSIRNDEGNDFAVFENSFSDEFLEFAHVEVSSDGERFVRIPSNCLIQTETQTGSFGASDPELVHNLAGKYRQGFGTPFDLEDIADSAGIDLNDVSYVRIIDVVGSIDPFYGTYDSEGNIINDPYNTDFESGGFDLDGVAVMHSNNPAAGISNETIAKMTVYPNPTDGIVNFQGDADVVEVAVYDLSGALKISQHNGEAMDLRSAGLAEGWYQLVITEDSGAVSRTKIALVR